jgi:hypothetical protein
VSSRRDRRFGASTRRVRALARRSTGRLAREDAVRRALAPGVVAAATVLHAASRATGPTHRPLYGRRASRRRADR